MKSSCQYRRIHNFSSGAAYYLPTELCNESGNPILVSYVAKGLLPYHGLGSGIGRALEAWPRIDFMNDQEGCLFTAIVHRKPIDELDIVKVSPTLLEKNKGKTSRTEQKTSGTASGRPVKMSGTAKKIVGKIKENPEVTIPELVRCFTNTVH